MDGWMDGWSLLTNNDRRWLVVGCVRATSYIQHPLTIINRLAHSLMLLILSRVNVVDSLAQQILPAYWTTTLEVRVR
jgi:hypothetical protein